MEKREMIEAKFDEIFNNLSKEDQMKVITNPSEISRLNDYAKKLVEDEENV